MLIAQKFDAVIHPKIPPPHLCLFQSPGGAVRISSNTLLILLIIAFFVVYKFLPKHWCHFHHRTRHSTLVWNDLFGSDQQKTHYKKFTTALFSDFSAVGFRVICSSHTVCCKILHTITFGAHRGLFDVRVQFI